MPYDNFTPWEKGKPITNSNLNLTWAELDKGIENVRDGVVGKELNDYNWLDASELTISAGAVTKTQGYHRIDTESDAASDDLTDINGGSEGEIIIIRAENDARDVVVKYNLAKIYLWGGVDVTLDTDKKHIMLIHDGTRWNELMRWITNPNENNPSYAKLTDTQSAGTNAGDGTSATYVTRVINTEDIDSDGIVSIAANQFTLQAGTYRIYAQAPAVVCGYHRIRLRNVTDGTTTLLGTSAYSNAADFSNTLSILAGEFTIAGAKAFEIQHRLQTGGASGWNLGYRSNTGTSEIYTVVEIWKYP